MPCHDADDAPQLLYAAGFLFMGATEEQMALVHDSDMDAVSYILILFSLAFLVFLFINMLIHLYDRLAPGEGKAAGAYRGGREGRLRDAEEFELDGLVSDDEDRLMLPGRASLDRPSLDRTSLDTPSTLGKNNVPSVR